MIYIPYIIFFILCPLASGYFIHLVYPRSEKNRFYSKFAVGENQLNIIGNYPAGGMLYRIIGEKDRTSKFLYTSSGIKDIHGHAGFIRKPYQTVELSRKVAGALL